MLSHSKFYIICVICAVAAFPRSEAFLPTASHSTGTIHKHVTFRYQHASNTHYELTAGNEGNPSSSQQDIEKGCYKNGRRLALETMASTGLLLGISAPTDPAVAATPRMDVNNALARGEFNSFTVYKTYLMAGFIK